MIYSMTAYAREEVKGDWGTAVWELRSVNQRYLETYFRLPEQFRSLEIPLRERFRKHLQRGKVECNLRFTPGNASGTDLKINETLALAVLRGAEWIQSQGANASVSPLDVLRWPGVISTEENDTDSLQAELLKGFDTALKSFIDHRGREGDTMKGLLEERLNGIGQEAAKVRQRMPEILQWQRDRILAKFTEAKIELDAERVEQEMVMLAQKTDVAEELDRLDSHIKETRSILN